MPLVALIVVMGMSSCNVKPEVIVVGKDQCCFCKMTVSDPKFGAEIVTVKGRNYKFDDMHCVLAFMHHNMIELKEIKDVPVKRLKELYQFVHSMTPPAKPNERLRKKILSFGGAFGDMSSKDYSDFLDITKQTRSNLFARNIEL